MSRIVTSTYRYKRPARKKMPVALEVPTVVTTKRSRRPVRKKAAAEEVALAAHSSTPRDPERDGAVTTQSDHPELQAWLERAKRGRDLSR